MAVGELVDPDPGGRGAADDLVVDVGDVHDPGDRVARASAGGGPAGRRTGTTGSCRCGPARRRSARTSRCGRRPSRSGTNGRVSPDSVSCSRSVIDALATVAIASAEIARPAPSAPSRLPVDALTLTALAVQSEQAARSRRASRRGASPSRGRAAMIVTSTEAGRQPARRAGRATVAQQLAAGDPARRPVVGREEPAEVAQGRRPEQRVGDRVERDVAVRVAVQPRRAGDLDAAEHQRRRRARTGGCRGRSRSAIVGAPAEPRGGPSEVVAAGSP